MKVVLLLHGDHGDDPVPSYFRWMLKALGTVVVVDEAHGRAAGAHDLAGRVDAVAEGCRRAGEPCLVLSFVPVRETPVGLACPIVPVVGWEPGDASGRDWRSVLHEARSAIAYSEASARAVREPLGEHFPVAVIPPPVWSRVARLHDGGGHRPDLAVRAVQDVHAVLDATAGQAFRASATAALDLAAERATGPPAPPEPRPLALHGVVYAVNLDPRDDGTSWQEIVRTFCSVLADRDDATLVLQSIRGRAVRREVESLLVRLRPFRCRVVLVGAAALRHASEALARASTYVVNAWSAEGPCVPLMEYMSCGRPAIVARHPGLEDYVDETNAFLVDTNADPAPVLAAALRESHHVAREEPERYRAMSRSAVERLRRHCSDDIVREKLVRLLLPQVRASGFPDFTFPLHGEPWPGPMRKLYSQGNEELIVRDFFGDARGGVFVDVGCAGPIACSTTCYLEKHLGWSGIGVDALPEYAPAWERERPRTRFVHAIVTDHGGTLDAFYRVPALPGLSTTDRAARATLAAERLEVPTTTLDALLDAHALAAIDFLSIDVERGERKLLAGFDLERFKPRLVCIECAIAPREVLDHFARHGYELIERYRRFDPVNWYFQPVP